MKASELFLRSLEAEGVEYVLKIPGEENLDFLDSLSRSSSQLIPTRHEQAAGFMAATYGRLTGRGGVCLSTLGPGATNFVTAAAYAQLGGMPMMMITGQKPVKSSKQGQFQIIDVVDMMRPLIKYTKQLYSGANIPSRIREAFRLAMEEKPGAVRSKMQLVVLVLRDNAYGMIKWKQSNMGLHESGLDYGNPDFVKHAESYGAHGYRIEKSSQLLEVMKQCHSSDGVHLIEVPVDYSENDQILNNDIRRLSAAV